MSQLHASVSQGRICSDKCTCCHTEMEVADQTFCLTKSQYTDTGPTSPSADLLTPDAWQGSHWSTNFLATGLTRPREKIPWRVGVETGTLTTRPARSTSSRRTYKSVRDKRSDALRITVGIVWQRTFVLLLSAFISRPPRWPSG